MASAWRLAAESHDASGTLFVNTFGVKMDPVSGDGLSPSDLAHACWDWFGSEYAACLANGMLIDSFSVRQFPSGTELGIFAPAVNGTYGAFTDMPRELAVICSWKTDVATRSGRGHIALPLPRHNDLLDGSLLAAGASVYRSHVADFFAKLAAGHDWGGSPAEGHLSHVVLSKKTGDYYDVKARILRNQIRWVERRQTAP